jgi:hypothetical protein
MALLLCVGCASVSSPREAAAQAPVWGSIELPFRSRYLFAGTAFGVEDVQQGELSIGVGGFSASGFAVYELELNDFIEADLSVEYYHQVVEAVGVFVGGSLYHFDLGPELGWEGTHELHGGVAISVPLRPSLYVAHDFDLGDGTHATLELSQGIPLGGGGLALELGGSVEYNAHYYTDDSGFAYFDLSSAVAIPLGAVVISPIYIVQRRLDSVFEYAIPDAEVWGITASVVFD